MLWHKGWLETRLRLLFVVVWEALFLGLAYFRGVKTWAAFAAVLIGGAALGAFAPILLAGSGINTQPPFQATKGLHGSTLFTLSLPVSRLRLLAVRAGIGWLELLAAIGVWCCGVWFLFPFLKTTTNVTETLEYAATLLVCGSGLYCGSLLLAAFLDDLWRMYGSFVASGMLWWLLEKTALPPPVNIFEAMSERSPLMVHGLPWTAMGLSLASAAALFFVTLKVVRASEY
jgi:hypothetical protein